MGPTLNQATGAISPNAVSQLRRVLVIDSNVASAKMLAEFLRALIPNCQVFCAHTEERAMRMVQTVDLQIIFVEYKGGAMDGLAFTRFLRRSELAVRQAPVIVVTAEATAAAIIGSRDAGVHEFLRRPYNMSDLKKRLDAIVLRPRDWIEAVSYVGPDRRRFNSADYKGPRKRRAEGASPIAQRIGQAIKIVQSAANALDSDRKQAMRSLRAQVRLLCELSAGNEALRALQSAALALGAYLHQTGNEPSREQLEAFAAQLLAAAPEDVQSRAA